MSATIANSRTIFGKEYILALSCENVVAINATAENWKKAGHQTARFKFKKTGDTIHLYASRFKTRSF
ncbi:hypothetical protein [Pseudopedobacter beijingensis]|uniref:Uncharacterized protein n=1 Tax=Pseudopedobacter beijingensis TaxID=1207056 RepID=A0ABW4II34_9SPHI